MHFNKNNLNLAQKSLFRKEQNQQFMSGFCASIYRLSPVFRKIPSYMRTKAIEEYLLFSERYHLILLVPLCIRRGHVLKKRKNCFDANYFHFVDFQRNLNYNFPKFSRKQFYHKILFLPHKIAPKRTLHSKSILVLNQHLESLHPIHPPTICRHLG